MRRLLLSVAVACLVGSAIACGGHSSTSSTPTAPGPSPAPANAFPYKLTGMVLENTPQGARPIAGASLGAWVENDRGGYSYGYSGGGSLRTDAAGNFMMPNLPPAPARMWVSASRDGYVQQCAVGPISLGADATVNVTLVARGNLSPDPSSVPASATGRVVTGRILEDTPTGQQGVANASVDFEPFDDVPEAITYSGLDGRYLLCGVQDPVWIGVGLGNRVKYVQVSRGQGSGIDIVLP